MTISFKAGSDQIPSQYLNNNSSAAVTFLYLTLDNYLGALSATQNVTGKVKHSMSPSRSNSWYRKARRKLKFLHLIFIELAGPKTQCANIVFTKANLADNNFLGSCKPVFERYVTIDLGGAHTNRLHAQLCDHHDYVDYWDSRRSLRLSHATQFHEFPAELQELWSFFSNHA